MSSTPLAKALDDAVTIAPSPVSEPPPPAALIDDASGEPVLGRFAGGIARWNPERFAMNPIARRLRFKRWHYVALVHPRLHVAVAIVGAGYLSSLLVSVFDREDGLAGGCMPKAPAMLPVDFAGSLARGHASFQLGENVALLRARPDGRLALFVSTQVAGRSFELDLDVELRGFTTLALTYPQEQGFVHTEKGAALAAAGFARWGDRDYALEREDTLAQIDMTLGTPPRSTRWNWCSVAGRLASGARIGINVTASSYKQGQGENAAFVDGALHPLGACAFEYDPGAPDQPWTIVSEDGRMRLEMTPRHVRREDTDLGLLRSRFIQPIGDVAGHVEIAGQRHALAGLFGVCEEHEAVW